MRERLGHRRLCTTLRLEKGERRKRPGHHPGAREAAVIAPGVDIGARAALSSPPMYDAEVRGKDTPVAGAVYERLCHHHWPSLCASGTGHRHSGAAPWERKSTMTVAVHERLCHRHWRAARRKRYQADNHKRGEKPPTRQKTPTESGAIKLSQEREGSEGGMSECV